MAETERDALFQILDALEALQIPYMLVGSFASTFWSRPCLTHDAALVVQIASEKVTDLARLLAPNFYAPEFVIEDAVRKHGQFNAIHLDVAFKIDLWPRKDAPYDVACFERRLLATIFGREVWVSSPEDVILSKLLWYRATLVLERQFQDVIEVYEVQEPYLQQDYLDRWAHTLGITGLLERVRQEVARPPDT